MEIYKGNKKEVVYVGLFFFVILGVLTFSLYVDGDFEDTSKVLALGGFWLMAVILSLFPLTMRLEVKSDHISTYIFGKKLNDIYSKDVQKIEYGYQAAYFGMHLHIETSFNGKKKTYRILEDHYGKKAVKHAKRVLEVGLSKDLMQ
jgi:hypothetical protein